MIENILSKDVYIEVKTQNFGWDAETFVKKNNDVAEEIEKLDGVWDTHVISRDGFISSRGNTHDSLYDALMDDFGWGLDVRPKYHFTHDGIEGDKGITNDFADLIETAYLNSDGFRLVFASPELTTSQLALLMKVRDAGKALVKKQGQ